MDFEQCFEQSAEALDGTEIYRIDRRNHPPLHSSASGLLQAIKCITTVEVFVQVSFALAGDLRIRFDYGPWEELARIRGSGKVRVGLFLNANPNRLVTIACNTQNNQNNGITMTFLEEFDTVVDGMSTSELVAFPRLVQGSGYQARSTCGMSQHAKTAVINFQIDSEPIITRTSEIDPVVLVTEGHMTTTPKFFVRGAAIQGDPLYVTLNVKPIPF